MALKTLVKVGSITNLSDARYCAGMGADMLGFCVIEGQKNYVSPKTFQEMRGWVTGPQIVAEIYGMQHAASLAKLIEDYRPDYLELSMDEFNAMGSALTLPFILSVPGGDALPHEIPRPAYIITKPDAQHFERLIPENDVLIAVSTREELELALQQTGISGVVLNGGQEIRPGLKNYDELSDILEALEVE